MQAGRRVEHDVRGALRRPHDARPSSCSQLPMRGSAGGPQAEPEARRLLAIDVAEHHRVPLPRELAGEVGGQRALADAALRVGDHDHRHRSSPCMRLRGYVNGARRTASAIATPCTLPPPNRVRLDADVARHRRPSAARALARQPRACSGARPQRGGRDVEVRDLYALYPDYLIDVAAEQARWRDAQLVVWQHPIHWYGMPPLLKLWVDEVLAFGWAYGPGGTRAARQGPVAGRHHRRAGAFVPHRRATTATSSTPSCRPTSRPPRCAACASCRRCCCTARTASSDAEIAAHAERVRRAARQLPRLARAGRAGRMPEHAEVPTYRAARAEQPQRPLMEHRPAWLEQQPGLPRRGGDRGAAGARCSASARSSATSRAGIAIGPLGPGARHATRRTMLHFAEFGVVLMLFLVGLELEPRRLWALRRPIFGWGSVQLFGSAALMSASALAGRRRLAARAGRGARPGAVVDRDRPAACWPSAT